MQVLCLCLRRLQRAHHLLVRRRRAPSRHAARDGVRLSRRQFGFQRPARVRLPQRKWPLARRSSLNCNAPEPEGKEEDTQASPSLQEAPTSLHETEVCARDGPPRRFQLRALNRRRRHRGSGTGGGVQLSTQRRQLHTAPSSS